MPVFVEKTSNLSKILCSHVIFFSNLKWKTPLLSCPYHIWSKNVNSVKTDLYYGSKKLIGCPFFPILTEKSPLSFPYFVKKTSILEKTQCSSVQISSKKNVQSLKTLCANDIFSNILWKTRCFQAHIWSKNVNSVKTTLYYGLTSW